MKIKMKILAVLLISSLALGACNNPKSARGFRLPDGNIEKGKQTFLALKCNACHRVDGVEMPTPAQFNLTLGGEVPSVATYGQLVTAIINPSHIVSKKYIKDMEGATTSPMPNLNAEMTVEQMIDLVAFLQSRYKLKPQEYHPTYSYPF